MSIRDQIQSSAHRNTQLLAILAETDFGPSALAQQTTYVANLSKELDSTTKHIAKLEKSTKKERKEHESYSESTVRRFAHRLGGKKGQSKWDEKASKEEREFLEAWQEESRAKERKVVLLNELAEAQKQQTEFSAVASRNQQAQKQLDELYDSIFEGPTPDFPEEDAKEYPVHEARREYDRISQQLDATKQAAQILTAAHQSMQRALREMASAEQSSQMDIIGFGGAFADLAERSALAQAQSHASQAVMLVEQARQIEPSIRGLGRLEVAQGNVMSDILFDNIFSDLRFHEKIQRSAAELRGATRVIMDELERATREWGVQRDLLKDAAGYLEGARKELQRVRQETFERVAGGTEGDVVREGEEESASAARERAQAAEQGLEQNYQPPPGPPPGYPAEAPPRYQS